MRTKRTAACLMMGFMLSCTAWADNGPNTAEIVAKMQAQLDLSQEQVTNVTPVIEKYGNQFYVLQQSVAQGSINPDAVPSQLQGLEANETQDLSQYLKPYQLSEWRTMQAGLYKLKDGDDDASSPASGISDKDANNPHVFQ